MQKVFTMRWAALFLAGLLFFACGRETEKKPVERAEKEPLFRVRRAQETGIDFTNIIREDKNRNIIRYQGYFDGGGVAAGDINNDGLIDLYFTGNMVQNRMYLNQGDFRFRDITAEAGLTEEGFGWYTGSTMVDINNDGFLDLYVCKSGYLKEENRRNLLYINNGDGTFTDKAKQWGIDQAGYSTQAAFFDYDRDGDLDMYLCNYGVIKQQFNDEESLRMRSVSDPFNGDRFFENVGGRYMDVTGRVGIIDHKFGFAHGIAVGDFNNDGWDDMYISNDFYEADYLYINQGDKTFRERLMQSIKHISNFSMGNDAADFNNDGLTDIFVLDMVAEDNRRNKENMGGMRQEAFDFFLNMGFHYQYMMNMLHMNNGNGTFSEIAHLAGISHTDWSWGPLLADFDNDGWKDLYIANGLLRDARNMDAKYTFEDILRRASSEGRTQLTDQEWKVGIESMPSERIKNYMYRNNRDLTFSNVTDDWGLGYASFSNGTTYADLDNDGDLDIVVNNISDPAFVFENRAVGNTPNHYLRIRFAGPRNNIDGLGTKVKIVSDGQAQYQQYYFTRGYRSCIGGPMHVGLGTCDGVDSLIAIWPDGKTTILSGVKAGQTLVLDYAEASAAQYSPPSPPQLFEEVTKSSGLVYRHREDEHDEFEQQPLLPYRVSRLGPFFATGDVDGDGKEDLYVGGAMGFRGALFLQSADGGTFRQVMGPWAAHAASEDMGATFFDADGDGDLDLYVVSGGDALPREDPRLQDRLYINDGAGRFTDNTAALPDIRFSGSRVAAHDFDEDGDMDLIVGGRLVPGQYGMPVRSAILQNEGGTWIDATESLIPALIDLGMVTDVLWCDLDASGSAELVVCGEWMPISVFAWDGARFTDVTALFGLADSHGIWYSLGAGDFDGDGDQDLVAGNYGLNHRFPPTTDKPYELYAGDLDQSGTWDVVLAYHEGNKLYPVRERLAYIDQFPWIESQIPTFREFARVTISDVFTPEQLQRADHSIANTFSSSYFENDGSGKMTRIALPNEAQISALNGMVVEDVDGDGHLDILAAGNLHEMEAETVRNDAGTGIFLKGDGTGRFSPLRTRGCGLYVAGDVKDVVMVETGGRKVFVFSRNNDRLQALRFAGSSLP